MTATTEQTLQTLEIVKDEKIAATIGIVFETLLEELGPMNIGGDGTPMHLKLEPWPGGRWYRDLGNNSGHFWGHVQAIKPPQLLEICGPLFLSYPVISNVQYRLTEEDGETRLRFVHKAAGQFPEGLEEGLKKGWTSILEKVRKNAERKSGSRKLG